MQPAAGLSDEELDKILKPHGGRVTATLPQINVHVVSLPENASEQAVAALLAHNPHLKFAEVDAAVLHDFTPNDPSFSSEWHLGKIGAPQAWDLSTGAGIKIAILDTGVDATHPDLQGQLLAGWNFYDNNNNVSDIHGHGTAMAGIVGATTNNAQGVASVAFGATILPIRISDPNGYITYYSTAANALTWAADQGARVASMSYAAYGSSTVQSAAQYMKNKGGLTVLSAGNTGAYYSAPASDAIVTVSATDGSDNWAGFSTYGPAIDFSAPGVSIATTARGGGYWSPSGTSASAPMTAATIALMFAANPSLTPVQAETILKQTVVDFGTSGWDQYFGWGRINTLAAVQSARNASTGDTQAPVVSIASPTGGTVSGLVPVSVNASDNVGVTKIELYDSGQLVATDTSAPFAFSWDTTRRTDGAASLVAKAFDAAGNAASSATIAVTVANATQSNSDGDTIPPVAAITNPGSGATVSGTVRVRATGSDNVGISSIKLYINGKMRASGNVSPLDYNWNTRKEAAGTQAIEAVVTDTSGNVARQAIQVQR